MATISYWARQDSITANNATLNPIGITGSNGRPAALITFTDDDPNSTATGDLVFDEPGTGDGLQPDPDTWVIIGGVTHQFTVQLTGTFPIGSPQVPDILEGRQVMVITVVVSGATREYIFVLGDPPVSEAVMNQIGNGAIPLGNLVSDYPCFCTGTEIATSTGLRKVETLVAGDLVLNDRGEPKPVLWVGASRFSLAQLRADPNLRPIRIAADAIVPGLPSADLMVSPQHRVVLEGAACELLFGEPRVLVPAKHLVGTLAEAAVPEADITYYHVLLEEHEILIANGLASESFQPAQRMVAVMAPGARLALEGVLAVHGRDEMLARKDALSSLKRDDARVLADAWPGRSRLPPKQHKDRSARKETRRRSAAAA